MLMISAYDGDDDKLHSIHFRNARLARYRKSTPVILPLHWPLATCMTCAGESVASPAQGVLLRIPTHKRPQLNARCSNTIKSKCFHFQSDDHRDRQLLREPYDRLPDGPEGLPVTMANGICCHNYLKLFRSRVAAMPHSNSETRPLLTGRG